MAKTKTRRRKRGNVPVVGSKQLHPVQIAPQTRRLEAKRARRAAHREYAPVLAADRQAVQGARRSARQAVGSARGGTRAVTSTLAEALGALQGTGLSGRELQQTRRDFRGRIGDAASQLPGLLAGLREEGQEGVQEARQQLLQDRAAMQKSAAGTLNQRLKELRGAGSSAIEQEQKERREKREEKHGKLSKSERRKIRNAEIALQRFVDNWKANVPVEDKETGEQVPSQQALPLKSNSEWRKVVEIVSGSEGVDPVAALEAVKRLRRKWHKNPKQPIVGMRFNAGS